MKGKMRVLLTVKSLVLFATLSDTICIIPSPLETGEPLGSNHSILRVAVLRDECLVAMQVSGRLPPASTVSSVDSCTD